MDNLLEALKTGSAFNNVREKREAKRRTPRAAGGNIIICVLYSNSLRKYLVIELITYISTYDISHFLSQYVKMYCI